MPLRPDRTPKHQSDQPATSVESPAPDAVTTHDRPGPSLELGRRLRRGAVLTAVLAGVVVGATALSAETAGEPAVARTAATTTGTSLPTPSAAELARLAESRSDERSSRSGGRAADPAKARALRAEARPGPQESRTRTVELGDPREIAQAMLADRGWSSSEFGCLDSLWVKESGWDPQAANPTSSAYGIPQALPGIEDGQRRRRLADEPGDPDRVGPGLHRGALRQPVRRLEPLAGQRLVLTDPGRDVACPRTTGPHPPWDRSAVGTPHQPPRPRHASCVAGSSPSRAQGRVMRRTSSAASSCSSVRSPFSTNPIARTTSLMVFSSANAVLATFAAFS